MKQEFLYLSDEWLRRNVTVEDALKVIDEVFRADGRGEVFLSHPPAQTLENRGDTTAGQALYKVKGAIVTSRSTAGFRLISFGPVSNTDREAKSVTCSFSYLTDPSTGHPIALVNESWLYSLRSGLTAVVAMKYLSPKKVRRAALIGAGRLARAVLAGLPHVLPEAEFRVASRNPTSARGLVDQLTSSEKTRFSAVADIREAVQDAEVVVTTTNANTEILHPDWLKTGATVCTLGGALELSSSFPRWANKFVVDDFEWCTMAGSIHGWIKSKDWTIKRLASRIHATIGEVASGLRPGRENDQENILAILQGMASCDLSLARAAYEKARHAPDVQRIQLS